MLSLSSDQGPQIAGQIVKEMCKAYQHQCFHCLHHPQLVQNGRKPKGDFILFFFIFFSKGDFKK